jgi:hypothetical protein
MTGQDPAGAAFSYDIPVLLQRFESLGDNCDFGVVQRAVGVEPPGLFRFAACSAADVGALLRARFQPLGETEDLWLDELGPDREYCVKSHRFSFEAHTDRYVGRDDPELVRTAQIVKMCFLKDRLIRELSRARRLFVFKGSSDTGTVKEIVAGLRQYGPNCLLWVNVADAAHPSGSVIRISDGLLLGFVDRFGTYDGDPSLPVEDWIAVCVNAYRLWREADPPRAPLQNLISEAAAAQSCQWFADPSAVTRPVEEPAQTGGVLLEHRLQGASRRSVCHVRLPIESGGSFVFSAWIRISEGFGGVRVGAQIHGAPTIASWGADLKSRARWQRIWVTADLPVEAQAISCGIVADGAVDDVFHSACWCLERGSRPLGYGFDR